MTAEGAVEYFDFIGMEKISSSSGASFSYENGKYYITISGISKSSEEIEIKVINKIDITVDKDVKKANIIELYIKNFLKNFSKQ